MKVYYIANEALDETTAQTIHIDEICRELTALGHDVTLYAPKTGDFRARETYTLSLLEVPDTLATVFFQLRLFFRLWRDMRRGKPEFIYSRHALLLFMPVLIGKVLGIPVVLEVNGPLLDESKRIDHSRQARTLRALGIFRRLESFSVRHASALVVVAPGIRDYLVRNYGVAPDAVSVVSNGVNTDVFKPRDVLETRAALGLEPEVVYLGYIGSLYPWQGVRYMIEAVALLLADRSDVKFLIVGKGDELPELEACVEEAGIAGSVTFLPAVPRDRVPAYIGTLDICLCYPTRFREGTTSPVKVYEYLACGKAVVLAELSGMREAFADAVAYAQPEAPAELAGRLTHLVDDRVERERLGAAGLALVEAGHTWAKVAERLVAVAEGARETRPVSR